MSGGIMVTRHVLLISVLGLAAVLDASELGLEGLKPSELKEIEKEIAAGNVPPNYTAEKPKRLAPKLSNAESPNFNQLGSGSSRPTYTLQSANSAAAQPTYTAGQAAAYAAAQQQGAPAYTSPLRLVYNNQQYVPNNQFLPILQSPHLASQLAAQYAYQPAAAVPHYLQTPTQIQYVSPPNYQQVPSAQFKALSAAKTATSSTPVSSAAATVPSQATSQVLLPSNMAAAHQQQPFLMYLFPQHHQQQLYYPGQQQMILLGAQNPLLSLYSGQHRFGFPYTSPSAASQLTYLTHPQQQFQQTLIPQDSSELQKQQQQQQQQPINVQDNTQQQTYGLRTKA